MTGVDKTQAVLAGGGIVAWCFLIWQLVFSSCVTPKASNGITSVSQYDTNDAPCMKLRVSPKSEYTGEIYCTPSCQQCESTFTVIRGSNGQVIDVLDGLEPPSSGQKL